LEKGNLFSPCFEIWGVTLTAQLSMLKGTIFLSHLSCISQLYRTCFINCFFFRIAAEKELLVLEHRKALDTQEGITAALKDQLMQAERRHGQELKEVQAAAEAKLDESLKDSTDASAQLQKELEEETRLRTEAQARIATLTTDQAKYDRLVVQADALAFSKFLSFLFS
jgi:hypothetical protein